ncbi:hypothetical protein PtA15_3A577 [Puccinia triticina]|uniref:mannan endo-1,6-alpha-mannosidase n=1 Tax=Puccinia triticina TaxID=208348 RepID=A0ABY7CE59_9BASI|nr:uncharacterized protein PtA15_3A577 [Puccinia triticina]WAQ83208.1 hypothetical protein PtA15_3A577 [Puccinia triticina]
MSFYTPNPSGVFDQAQTPWHAKYTGDTQDLLGGAMSSTAATLLGRWNDDILWHSLEGAEFYGANSIKGPWITPAQKTYDQTYQQWDDGCGGGIYWLGPSQNIDMSLANRHLSLTTQLEFIQQGARNFMANKNHTALDLWKAAMDWVFSSGLGNVQTGVLYDGMNVGECGKFTSHIWSYNYGALLGALAWMHKATGNNTYLDLVAPFYNYAQLTFSGQKVSNVVTETCEPGAKCNRDQQGFKAIYLRNLAYTCREVTSDQVKGAIKSTIDASVAAMVQYSCDDDWFCNGNWTADASPVKYVRSQHVAAALLVSALGVHLSPEGGLLPKITPGQLTNTTNGAAGLGSGGTKNPGKVTSKPLAAASGLKVTFSIFLGLFTVAFSTSMFDPLAFIP